MKTVHIPCELQKMGAIFAENGFESYLVGGAVRDMLMHKKASDWDLATNATPQDVMRIFKKVVPTGIQHGTVTVFFMQKMIEVTTFRTESKYSDGRHPDEVNYASTIEEDLSRRDFTMNAIAANLKNGELVDPFEGQKDIKQKIIRTVLNPLERFSEDGLRPVRAVRFASQLGFIIEEKTLKSIKPSLNVTKKIALERFHDELVKMLKSPRPSTAFLLMEETGILEIFLPELCNCRGVLQKGFHAFDVLDHLLYTVDGAPQDNLLVRLASLLHDVAKPAVRTFDEKNQCYTFYNHEAVSCKMAKDILTRLRFCSKDIDYVCHLIKQHMFFYEDSWTDSAVRRFLVRINYAQNAKVLDDLFFLRLADIYGMQRQKAPIESLLPFKKRIDGIIAKDNALSLKDLAVSGKDLIAIGIPSGKQLGIVLNELFNTVLDDPASNTKDALLEIAKRYYAHINHS